MGCGLVMVANFLAGNPFRSCIRCRVNNISAFLQGLTPAPLVGFGDFTVVSSFASGGGNSFTVNGPAIGTASRQCHD